MNKKVFLFIVTAFFISGCNLFQAIDVPMPNEDTSVAELNNLMEGGSYTEVLTAIETKLSKNASYNGGKADVDSLPAESRAEYTNIMTMKAEATLGETGVNMVEIMTTMAALTTTTETSPDNAIGALQGILDQFTSNMTSLKTAVDAYANGLPTSPSAVQAEELKDSYMVAGMATGIYVTALLKETFLDTSDAAAANVKWSTNSASIVTSLNNTVNFLSIALGADNPMVTGLASLVTTINNIGAAVDSTEFGNVNSDI